VRSRQLDRYGNDRRRSREYEVFRRPEVDHRSRFDEHDRGHRPREFSRYPDGRRDSYREQYRRSRSPPAYRSHDSYHHSYARKRYESSPRSPQRYHMYTNYDGNDSDSASPGSSAKVALDVSGHNSPQSRAAEQQTDRSLQSSRTNII